MKTWLCCCKVTLKESCKNLGHSEKVKSGIPEPEGVRGALVLGPGERPVEWRPLHRDQLSRAGDTSLQWRGCKVRHWHPRLVKVREGSVPHAQEPPVCHRLQKKTEIRRGKSSDAEWAYWIQSKSNCIHFSPSPNPKRAYFSRIFWQEHVKKYLILYIKIIKLDDNKS